MHLIVSYLKYRTYKQVAQCQKISVNSQNCQILNLKFLISSSKTFKAFSANLLFTKTQIVLLKQFRCSNAKKIHSPLQMKHLDYRSM